MSGRDGRVRIVHVANFYGPESGGLRTTMHALGTGYRARGHEFVMVVPGRRGDDELTPSGRRLTLPGRRLLRSGGYQVLTDVDRVRSVLQSLAPDRLEVSDRLTLRSLGPWARARGVPSACFAHERLDGVLREFGPSVAGRRVQRSTATATMLADAHNRGTATRFDHVVCTTAYAAEEFVRIGAENVVRVPLGVALAAFSPTRRDPALRARLASPEETLVVLASRLSREKRPDLVIDTVRLLYARGMRVRLVVAGAGPMARSLHRRAHGLPVTFLGYLSERTEMARLLATADLVMAPGPIETFGLAALEALASGTPVVASDTSALREIVSAYAGATARPDPYDLARAVRRVLSRPEHERRVDARARAEELPWDRTVCAMLDLHGVPGPRTATAHAAP